MRSNVRGRVRGYLSTVLAGLNLVHLNLLRVAVTSPRTRLKAYADAVFKLQMEFRCREIDFLELGDALRRLDRDPIHVDATLVDVGDYRGRSDWERLFLGALARSYGDRPAFEIGTASGNTTCLLAANTDATVYTLDLPDSEEWQPTLTRLGSDDKVRWSRRRAEFIRAHPEANIVELVGDSATFDYTDYHDRIGLFFVDGAHSLEYVRSDTMNAAWCCGNGSVVVWDDFTTTRDVTDYVRSLKASGVELYGLRGTRLAFTQDIAGLQAIARRLGTGLPS
jgi:predicted O-methyltransferase YrrM